MQPVGRDRVRRGVPPIVTVCTCARPCVIATMFSERVSTQVTGRSRRCGEPRDQRVLGVGAELGAERAADGRRDDVHLLGRHAEHPGQRALGALRALVRDPGGQPVVVVPHRGGGAHLERRDRDALVERSPGSRRPRSRRRCRPARPACAPKHTFVPTSGNSTVSSRQRGLRVDDGGQRLVLDVDEFGGVLALVALVGEHDGDRLADEAHDVASASNGWPIASGVHRQRRPLVDRVGEFGGGEHGDAAGATRAPRSCRSSTMRACAIGERTIVSRSAPARRGSSRSSV